MKAELNEITVNGTVYVPKSATQSPVYNQDGLQYVLIRSGQSGVWGGYLKSKTNDTVELVNARRLWRWYSNELCEVAVLGLTPNNDNRISVTQPHVFVLGVCEIHDVTETARKSIEEAKVWKSK